MDKGNSHWEVTTLGDICRRGGGFIQTGPFGSQLHASDYVEDGIPTIMPKNIGENKVIEDEISRVSPEDVERLRKYKVQTGDIVYSRRGDVTLRALIREQQDGWLCGTGSLMIRLGKGIVDPKFVSYFLGTSNSREWIQNHAVGATMPNLNTSIMSAFPIAFPDLSTQQKIAAVLSALDAKIELNARINAELESMAKTLYDYWFVQYQYPTPSALSGTSPKFDRSTVEFGGGRRGLVWNEALKREIPLGWEVDNIMRLGDLLGGGTPKTSEPSYWGGNIPFFTPKDTDDSIFVLNTMDCITEAGLESCSSRLYPKGTIFITARGTVGKINVASQDMAMNQSCYAIQAKPEINYYFLHQHSVHLVQYLKAKSNGSIFDAIVSNDIKLTPIVIPPLSLIQKFGEHTKGLYEKILVNKQESQTLTELRDWLLPMLMNGQVSAL